MMFITDLMRLAPVLVFSAITSEPSVPTSAVGAIRTAALAAVLDGTLGH